MNEDVAVPHEIRALLLQRRQALLVRGVLLLDLFVQIVQIILELCSFFGLRLQQGADLFKGRPRLRALYVCNGL